MGDHVHIIVVGWDGERRRIYGDRAEYVLHSEEDALESAKVYCKKGLCVIIRPNYNDDDGLSFHEYRSFDGGEFIRVSFPGMI